MSFQIDRLAKRIPDSKQMQSEYMPSSAEKQSAGTRVNPAHEHASTRLKQILGLSVAYGHNLPRSDGRKEEHGKTMSNFEKNSNITRSEHSDQQPDDQTNHQVEHRARNHRLIPNIRTESIAGSLAINTTTKARKLIKWYAIKAGGVVLAAKR